MASKVRLEWEGKRPAQTLVSPLPVLRRTEEYGAAQRGKASNRLILGENLAVMATLREEFAGRFALIYLDPPFFTGAEWQAQVRDYEMPAGTQPAAYAALPAFTDQWRGDLGVYLQWLLDRLTLARELLTEDGSLYVHLSRHAVHYAKLLLDEIFGEARFQNEIVWCYREAINSKKRWNRKHDTILFYSKGEKFTFNHEAVREPYAESHVKKYRLRDEKGLYRLMGRGIVGSPLRCRRDLPAAYETQFPDLTYRHYLGEGTLPVDYWRIDIENQASPLRTGYPTQKPEALLERILLASSNPGDLVGDFCCGSGTTPAVAARLGRRWIACDAGPLAVHTTRKRLLETPDCGDFTVESVEAENKSHNANPAWEGAVCFESGGDGRRVRLAPNLVSRVDMWAVEWKTAGEDAGNSPFRPDWWTARTRRRPELDAGSPVCPLPAGRLAAKVALTTPAGETTLLCASPS